MKLLKLCIFLIFAGTVSAQSVPGSGGNSSITAGGINGVVYQSGASTGFAATATGGAGTLCLTSASGGVPTWGSCAGSAATAWSSLSNPSGAMSINVGTNTSLITVAGNTSASNMFSIIDTTGNTGTGSLFEVNTVGTSTAHPFTFTAQGTANGIQMSTAGAVAAIGTGSIAANMVTGFSPASSKVLTLSNTLTFTGTDSSSVAFGAGGTVAYTNVATLSSLSSIGTISTGTWQGTVVGATYGGTGVNNGSNTLTLAGPVVFTGAFSPTFAIPATGTWTFPAAGTLVNTGVTTLSSLASIGTISTGTWQGSLIAGTYGGTGVNNGAHTITLAGNLSTTGAFNTTIAQSASVTETLPSTSFSTARIDAAQTFTGIQTFSTPIAAGSGGSGIANTATLTLGTSNQNWATLGTGIVKNTTTTGALTDAAASDIYSLFTSCTGSSGLFLKDGGTCASAGGGSPALSSVTAATGSNTIASGNNGLQIWNWAPTSNQVSMQFGETTAATGGTLGNQYGVKIVTLAGSTSVPLNVTSSLTGSQTLPTLHITPTWNTFGVVDAALLINPTNTASGTGSLLIDAQLAGTSQWKVDKAGNSTQLGSVTTGSGSGVGGTESFVSGTAGTVVSNAWGWTAPTAMTTSWYGQSPNGVPTANQIMLFPAPTSNVSQWAWTNFTLTGMGSTFSSPLNLSSNAVTCATCVTSAAALTSNGVVIGQGGQATAVISAVNNALLITNSSAVPAEVAAPSACTGGQFSEGLTASAGALSNNCATPSGGGNVSNSGTPAQFQLGVWVTSTTIAGISVPANGTMLQGNSGANPSWTATPALGVASTTTGSLGFLNASNAFTFTIVGAAAMSASNTIAGPLSVPANGDLLDCATTSTTCTLTDVGFLASNVVRKDTSNTGASGMTLDLSAASATAGLKLPSSASAAPIADGFIAVNTATHALVIGSNTNTIVAAVAAVGATNFSTICSNQFVSTISAVAAPTCQTVTPAYASGQTSGSGNFALVGSPALTGTPTAPTAALGTTGTQIATLDFVNQAIAAQVEMHDAVQAATTTALINSPTYSNGSSGVGATLTATVVGVLILDGYTPVLGDRLLIKNQASTFQNGCYTVTTLGVVGTIDYVLTRCTDFNQTGNIDYGDTFPVLQGTTNANQQFTMNNNASITVGTTAITFAQTSGGSQLTASAPIVITGNALSAPTAVTSAAVLPNLAVVLGAGGAQGTQATTNLTANTSGLFTAIDGITTVGLGVPIIGWQSALSNSSAVSLVTLVTSATAGDYEIHFNLDMHTACTTGSEQLALSFAWTGNSSRTLQTGNVSLGAAQTTSSFISGVQPIHVASGNITYTPTLTGACATGTATWDGDIYVTRAN